MRIGKVLSLTLLSVTLLITVIGFINSVAVPAYHDSPSPLQKSNLIEPTANLTTQPPANPWQSYTISVSIAPHDSRNLENLVFDAITYWNTDGAHYNRHKVHLEFNKNDFTSDIRIYFSDNPNCRQNERTPDDVAGCAPTIRENDTNLVQNRTLPVRIRTGYTNDSTRYILIHELGHVLGLTHNNKPQEYMSAEENLEKR